MTQARVSLAYDLLRFFVHRVLLAGAAVFGLLEAAFDLRVLVLEVVGAFARRALQRDVIFDRHTSV